jgi:hypothetical protein
LKIEEMTVDPEWFDRVTLNEAEQQFVMDVLAQVGPQLTALAMTKGVVAATQAAAGSVARMIKANLEGGIQVASLSDVKALRG